MLASARIEAMVPGVTMKKRRAATAPSRAGGPGWRPARLRRSKRAIAVDQRDEIGAAARRPVSQRTALTAFVP